MTKSAHPAPRELGKDGARFWRETHAAYELDTRDRPVLLEVCRVLDQLEQLTQVIARDGVMSVGAKGQPREHAAMGGLRAHRLSLDRLLIRLALPDLATGAIPLTYTQERAKKAAAARWKNHVPRGAEEVG